MIQSWAIFHTHDHPSKDLRVSQVNNRVVNTLKVGGKLLDVMVLGRLILTSQGYYSLADKGVL